jgi:hypothetical protein
MNWPDLSKRSNAILILLVLDILFYVGMIVAYLMPHASDAFRAVARDAFLGVSAPLLLALKLSEVPTLPPNTTGTVQTTTTVASDPPKENVGL